MSASFDTGNALYTLLQSGPVTARVKTSTESDVRQAANVLADTKKGDPNNVVVVGAHLDSVLPGPGVNDNGSGSATILAIAEQLTKFKTTNKVRFACWGAEELGLVGSSRYVASLSDAQKDAIALNLNFDMVGSPNFVRFVYNGDNSAFPSGTGGTQPGPPGSGAIEEVFGAVLPIGPIRAGARPRRLRLGGRCRVRGIRGIRGVIWYTRGWAAAQQPPRTEPGGHQDNSDQDDEQDRPSCWGRVDRAGHLPRAVHVAGQRALDPHAAVVGLADPRAAGRDDLAREMEGQVDVAELGVTDPEQVGGRRCRRVAHPQRPREPFAPHDRRVEPGWVVHRLVADPRGDPVGLVGLADLQVTPREPLSLAGLLEL